MKKLFLSIAVVAGLTMVSCNSKPAAAPEEVVEADDVEAVVGEDEVAVEATEEATLPEKIQNVVDQTNATAEQVKNTANNVAETANAVKGAVDAVKSLAGK